jgi:hypothetical protein
MRMQTLFRATYLHTHSDGDLDLYLVRDGVDLVSETLTLLMGNFDLNYCSVQ